MAGDRETTLDLLAASLIRRIRLGERFRDQVAVPIDVGRLLDDRVIKLSATPVLGSGIDRTAVRELRKLSPRERILGAGAAANNLAEMFPERARG